MAKQTTKKDQANYAELDQKALDKALAQKQQDLIEAKKSHKSGELINPRVLSATRKDIARIKTALKQLKLKESE